MKHSELICKDFLVSNEEFHLEQVEKYTGLLRSSPTPLLENLSKYYESDEYISHSDKSQGLMNRLYYLVKKYNLQHKYNLVTKSIEGNKIMDYGCGTGEFVAQLQDKNCDAYGFEPNKNAFEIAQKKFPNKIFQTSELLEKEKFDAITLWHVLEHVPNLFEEIQRLKSALKLNGKLFVAVPNYESYDAGFYKNYWAAYDVPRHLWHFSQDSIQEIFDEFGMIVEQKYPMWFDAFYVSLLSEKYKRSSLGILRAPFIGLISNLKASQNGQFSSIIYKIGLKN